MRQQLKENALGRMKPLSIGEDGHLSKAIIIIYEETIKEQFDYLQEIHSILKNNPHTKPVPEGLHAEVTLELLKNLPANIEELIGINSVHESEHGLNEQAQAYFNNDPEKREEIADKAETQAVKETPLYRLQRLTPISAQLKINK